ncbi:hypothetical protein ACIQB5_46445 [Streptomyces sp. NPDC088560]|uniref:hypothetical protein n=1 Tax=Streptomyces sp. NPDC088560 TaxID=3365868 RepID=UPI00380EEEC9
MPDPMQIAVVSSILPAVTTFVVQRVERLLSSFGAEPEDHISVPSSILAGGLQLPLEPDADRLRDRRGELELLQDFLIDHTPGDATAASPSFLRRLAQARDLLEGIYGQRITFVGEDRPASGPFVHQKLKTVSGEATGMDADEIAHGSNVTQDVETVDAGAKLIGMKARRISQQ